MQDCSFSGLLESGGLAAAEWLLSEVFERQLFSFFPCSDTVPAPLGAPLPSLILDPAAAAELDDRDCSKEVSLWMSGSVLR